LRHKVVTVRWRLFHLPGKVVRHAGAWVLKVLFISGELIAGDLPYRLSEEGCDVKLFIEHPDQQDCQSGFVTKIDDWRSELGWVGKAGLIVFDDVGFGEIQDQLRRDGFRVFGGSAGGDRLELDREFAQRMFAELGIEILPTLRFEHPTDAARHIRTAEPCRWVVKQNNHDYVPRRTMSRTYLTP
jgi:hypothetical protein